jgi:hypothetical protein
MKDLKKETPPSCLGAVIGCPSFGINNLKSIK